MAWTLRPVKKSNVEEVMVSGSRDEVSMASALLFLGSLAMEEASHHVVRTLKQPCGNTQVVRTGASCHQPA